MKHGPIALIDEQMPVVALAPHDHVFEKMIGNMQEVKARGGSVIALTTRGDDKLSAILDPVRRLHPRAAADARAAHADRDGRAAAAARLRHRRPPRLRRRSAAESREERHGRIGRSGTRARRAKRIGIGRSLRRSRADLSPDADSSIRLNPEQREAVLHINGPLLILAGAGRARRASSPAASPTSSATATRSRDEVLAVTFTNKAAEEMRARVEALLGADCSRHVGLDVPRAVRAAAAARSAGHRPVARLRHLRLVRPAHRRQAGAEGAAHRRQLRAAAGGAVAHQPRQEPDGDARTRWPRRRGWNRRDEQIAKIYSYYLNALKEASALDFDDLLLKTVELFEQSPSGPRRSTPSSSGS